VVNLDSSDSEENEVEAGVRSGDDDSSDVVYLSEDQSTSSDECSSTTQVCSRDGLPNQEKNH